MIVTAWPSSRSDAISPPQDSAASSGCGAMKTSVIAAEDSIGRPGSGRHQGPRRSPWIAVSADQRDEDARVEGALLGGVPDAPDDRQDLALARPDRDHEARAFLELLHEGIRDGRRCRG